LSLTAIQTIIALAQKRNKSRTLSLIFASIKFAFIAIISTIDKNFSVKMG